MIFRYLSALCLLWASTLGLQGCGGGSGTDSNNAGGNSGGSAAAAVQAGVYYAAVNGQDFWGVITPNNHWYGLHYATNNPDIYAGDVTSVGTLQASVPSLKYQNTADTVLSGSASLTSTGTGKLSGALSLITSPSIPAVTFSATTPAGFTYSQAAQLSTIAGNWSGQLSFGSGESGSFAISIAADSGTVTASRSFASCQWQASTSLATPLTNANLFALTLHMENATSCDPDLDGKTLTGIAFASPVPGGGRRLIWVATTPEGHAISFKADR